MSASREGLVSALDAPFLAAALALAYAVKRAFSQANADELGLLLRPTAWLVELVTGHRFAFERGAGYVNYDLAVAIAPACSGTNFLIVAFVTLIFAFVARMPSLARKFAWFGMSAAIAYLSTLAANSLRISLALAGKGLIPAEILGPQALHRALGVAVYLGCLLVLFTAADRAVRGARVRSALLVPLGAYVGVTLLVPLVRGGAVRPEYLTHALVVLFAVACAMLCLRVRRSPAQTGTASWRVEHPILWREAGCSSPTAPRASSASRRRSLAFDRPRGFFAPGWF